MVRLSTAHGKRLNSSSDISSAAVAEKSAVSEAICLAESKTDDESFTSDLSNDSPPLGIGDTATIRFLKARNKILSQEVMQCRESADEAVIETLDLRKELHRTVKENEKAVKQLAQEKVKVDKLKKAKEVNENMASQTQLSLAELQGELCKLHKIAKDAAHARDVADANLHHVVEDSNRSKISLQKALFTSLEVEKAGKQEIGTLKRQVQQLEQQKQELISIFKKQLRLIDTLKRQKVHAEAAHLLTFTEQDYAEALDWAASIREVPSI